MRPASLIVLIAALSASVATSRGTVEPERSYARVHLYSAEASEVEIRYAAPVRCDVLERAPWLAASLSFPEAPSHLQQLEPRIPVMLAEPEPAVDCFAVQVRSGVHEAVLFVDSLRELDTYDGSALEETDLRPGAVVLVAGEAGGFLDGGVDLVQDPADLGYCEPETVTWSKADVESAAVVGVVLHEDCTVLELAGADAITVCGTSLPVETGDRVTVFADAAVFELQVEGGLAVELGRDLDRLGTLVPAEAMALGCVQTGICGALVEAEEVLVLRGPVLTVGEPKELAGGMVTLLELRSPLNQGCGNEGVYRLDL